MAKCTGPLFSLDARNSVAKTIVYSYWKGRNYARVRIVPKNPKEDLQAEARLYMGCVGKNNKMIESKAKPGVLMTQIIEKTPPDQSWMSYFAKTQIGLNWVNIKAARVSWGTLPPETQALWETAAATIPITGFDIGYGVVTKFYGAEQLFVSAYGAWLLGLAIITAPPAEMVEADINAFAAAYAAAV